MEVPLACCLSFCDLVLPLAFLHLFKFMGSAPSGSREGVWLVCNKHLAVVKARGFLVLVPACLCGPWPG